MTKRKRAALLPTNIALLQNLLKRDPSSYYDDFVLQYKHYESLRDIYLNSPQTKNSQEFAELIGFVAQVAVFYPKETHSFPDELSKLLTDNYQHLEEVLRDKIIQSMVLLKNKGVITAERLISIFFPILLSSGSKSLRSQIYKSIVSTLKIANTGTKAQKLNKSIQALLFNILECGEISGLWVAKLTRELWRRRVWDDSRTVELMTQVASYNIPKIAISGVRFFLGADRERTEALEEDDSDSDTMQEIHALKHKLNINKKTKKRNKQAESAVLRLMKKHKRSSNIPATYLNLSALHLLRNPQDFAEKLFSNVTKQRYDLEQKILILNLVSRMIGTHKLTILEIYSYLLKYLTPKQKNVTQFMAISAQACHDLVSPDIISPIVRKISDEFVSDGVSTEVCSAGINCIREILSRNPLAIEAPLLQDLTKYKNSKAKSVVMASRSLISLYREVAPEMLASKDRGKITSMLLSAASKNGSSNKLQYGVEKTQDIIEGLDLLVKWKSEQDHLSNDNSGWEIVSDLESESESEDEWVNIESDKDYALSDSDNYDVNLDEKKLDNKESEDSKSSFSGSSASEIAVNMMATKILTPADFAKLDELKVQAGFDKLMGKVQRNEEEVDATKLVGPLKYKQLREEKIAHAKEGREGREKFGSRKSKRNTPHSTTNREKAHKKNIMMQIHKKGVQSKMKRSLREKRKVLRAHTEKQKKKGF